MCHCFKCRELYYHRGLLSPLSETVEPCAQRDPKIEPAPPCRIARASQMPVLLVSIEQTVKKCLFYASQQSYPAVSSRLVFSKLRS